jgi:hypothetical protein
VTVAGAAAEDAIGAVVRRLSRPGPAGGAVIERAAILAEGADSTAIIDWIFAHAGHAEAIVPPASMGGLHGVRSSESLGGDQRPPRRYVLPAGALA